MRSILLLHLAPCHRLLFLTRRYPGDGSEGADAFAMERMRLEGNLQDNAINCPVEEGCEYDPNNPGMQ